MTVPSYYDFPRCRAAFARGQKDARPCELGLCHYRLRGRTRDHFTLLSFDTPGEAWLQMKMLKRRGARVQVLAYTYPQPPALPTRSVATEWWTPDYAAILAGSGKRASELRRALRHTWATHRPSRDEVTLVFDEWKAWAGGRHFMVFKGHYERWLYDHFADRGPTHLIGVYSGTRVEGIFGWETMEHKGRTVACVVIAKHTPRLRGRELWVQGLNQIGSIPSHCGSTADDLKAQLGLTPMEAWTFDLRKLS